MLEWILEKLPVVIFVLVFAVQLVRGFLRSRAAQAEPPPRHNELEEQRRAQEVQAEIRRKIAERRAGRTQTDAPRQETTAEEAEPPVVERRDDSSELPVPEPLKRMLRELERKVEPALPPPLTVPQVPERRAAELERQQQLADELRSLEETRVLARRRAASAAATKTQEARSEAGLRSAARGRVLDDLHDPESLRRAFVLREVLGPPVGLR